MSVGCILDDKRDIEVVWWDDDYGSEVRVGRQDVTAIIPYSERGEMSMVPWLAVMKGDDVIQRINPKSVAGIAYKESDTKLDAEKTQ